MSIPGLARWKRALEANARRVEARWPARPEAPRPAPGGLEAGFIYSGQRHETVPRRLLLDNRLTPLERNAWQVIRLLIDERGLSTPRYEDLQACLSSVPCGAAASRETVARVLTLLRLTRWLSLVARGRDPRTGRLRGSLYVLHDEPLTPAEALELDDGYLELLANSLGHAAKTVRTVAAHVVEEVRQDADIDRQRLPTRLEAWAARSAHPATDRVPTPATPLHESEPGPEHPVRIRAHPGSDSEPGAKTGACSPVRMPNQDRTVLNTNTCIEKRTVPRTRAREGEASALAWPAALTLRPPERQAAQGLLDKLPAGERQAVLDEAGARCAAGGIRKPGAYLMGLIQRALQGQFRPWAALNAQAPPHHDPPPAAPPMLPQRAPGEPPSAEVQRCLEELRRLGRARAPDT